MSRVIKFRVWNYKEKKFFTQDTDQRIDLALEYYELHKHVEWPQQFTGLLDKNGKEIYEGDVLTDGGIVEWVQDSCQFCINYKEYEMQEFDSNDMEWCEVIGDIYSTPHLIK